MISRGCRPLPRGCRRGAACGLVALTVAGAALAPVASARSARVPASQALAVLLDRHVARRGPNDDARRLDSVDARRPLTQARTVLPVLDRAGRHDAWLRVLLPGRPNGHSGWISARRTRVTSTPWRIRVSIDSRRVVVFREGRVVRRFLAIVGKSSTPTPRGRFFVEEALRLRRFESGAPFALATSARSNVFQEFDGGPGQIAIHGTGNLTGTAGTAVSHGCVRLGTPAIAWLASRIGAGVPISIGRRS